MGQQTYPANYCRAQSDITAKAAGSRPAVWKADSSPGGGKASGEGSQTQVLKGEQMESKAGEDPGQIPQCPARQGPASHRSFPKEPNPGEAGEAPQWGAAGRSPSPHSGSRDLCRTSGQARHISEWGAWSLSGRLRGEGLGKTELPGGQGRSGVVRQSEGSWWPCGGASGSAGNCLIGLGWGDASPKFQAREVGGFREVSVGDLQVVRAKSGKKSGWEEEESSWWAAW